VSPFNSLLVSFGLTAIIEALISGSGPQTSAAWNPPTASEIPHRRTLHRASELLTLTMALALSLLTWVWLRHTYTGRRCARSPRMAIAAAFGVNVRGLSLLLSGLCAAFAASRACASR